MTGKLLRTAFAALTFLLFAPAFAGPLDKAFKALEVHNYFQARDIFLKQARKHPAPSWYGLSVIAGRDNNPFHDLDSAHQFSLRADVAYTASTDRQRTAMAKWGVDHEAIEAQKRHVYTVTWETPRGVTPSRPTTATSTPTASAPSWRRPCWCAITWPSGPRAR